MSFLSSYREIGVWALIVVVLMVIFVIFSVKDAKLKENKKK